MKRYRLFIIIALTVFCFEKLFSQENKGNTVPWGDQGNGIYINPILYADYSDPDVIRTGDDYYMICSEFHFMGMPVLHSRDLVNWTIISRVYDSFRFAPEYDFNERYAGGSWAPAIRFHDNKYWIYFCTPKEGLFMTTALKPEGPWAPLCQVCDTAGWEDPCPFWDDDGQAYLGRSKVGAGPIYLHKMSPDGKKLLGDGVIVYTGPVAEGTKIYKKDGYYFLSIPEGGVSTGWQTVLRSKNIDGPYEKKVVLEQGMTAINGPHQGAWIDTPAGEWWFIHFQSVRNIGRVCHLEPMRWKDGWPVIGADLDMNGIGEPVYVYKKPDVGKRYTVTVPQSSDEFDSPRLGFQWSWNHNPVPQAWSLNRSKGCLDLMALPAPSFPKAKNTITQKVMGPAGTATALLITGEMENGQKAGLCLMGKQYNLLGIEKKDGKLFLFTDINGELNSQDFSNSPVYLRVLVSQKDGSNQFYYSQDNRDFIPLGKAFTTNEGYWKGPKLGLFSYSENGNGGTASFDWFHYLYDGPETFLP